MRLWKRAEWQTKSNALEKSIVDRIFGEPGLGLLNPSEMDWERYRIWSRVDRPGRKLAWRGEKLELDSRKKSKRDRMMRSKSFDTQELREIDRKESGKSRGFSSLCMVILKEMSSRWKGRNAKTRKDWRCEEENPCQSEEGALAWDRQLCLGQWQWTRRGWRQPHEIQREGRESKKTSETAQGTWLGGTQRGSLWLCYASGSQTFGVVEPMKRLTIIYGAPQ